VVGGSLPEDANVIAEVDGDGVAIAANANTVMGNRLGLPYGGGLGNHLNGSPSPATTTASARRAPAVAT
jgi:hypothetical protein